MVKKQTELFKSFLIIIFGSIILCTILFGLYLVYRILFNSMSAVDPQIIIAIIGAVTAILGSFITVSIGKYFERKKALEFEIRQKKIPIYEDLLDFLIEYLKKQNNLSNQEDFNLKYMNLAKSLTVWGSDEVIKEWTNYQRKNIDPLNFEEL